MTKVLNVKVLDEERAHCIEDLGPYSFEQDPREGDQVTLLFNDTLRTMCVVRFEHQPLASTFSRFRSETEMRASERTILMVRPSALSTSPIGKPT